MKLPPRPRRHPRLRVEWLEDRLAPSLSPGVDETLIPRPDTVVLVSPTQVIVQNGPKNGPEIATPFPSFLGEKRVTVGDVNDDGTPDYIFATGGGGGPEIEVVSGADGSVISNFFAFDPNFRGGVFLATADMNGDGFSDIIAAAGAGGGPEVRIFSGQDGAVLADFFAYDPSFRGGATVAASDVTGDGVPDIVTGPGPGGGSQILVIDGTRLDQRDPATAQILPSATVASFYAFDPSFQGGASVALGNLDGDKHADIVVGPLTRGNPTSVVFSGATLHPIQQLFLTQPGLDTGLRFIVADVNGDGIDEVVVVPGPGGGPQEVVINPLTGQIESSVFFTDPASRTGFDAGNNSNFDTLFTSDTTPPAITVTSPSPGAISNRNAAIAGTVSDDRSGVASLQAALDGGGFAPVSLGPNGSFSFPTNLALDGSADGMHTEHLKATDNVGNVSTTAVSFTLDTIAPAITVTSPSPGTISNRNAVIAGTVTDDRSGVASLQAALDGGGFAPVSLGPNGSFSFPTNLALDGSADGVHTEHLKATDNAGNVSTTAVSFTLDTIAPAVDFQLDPASDTAPVGDGHTEDSVVSLTGTTEPNTVVTLEETGLGDKIKIPIPPIEVDGITVLKMNLAIAISASPQSPGVSLGVEGAVGPGGLIKFSVSILSADDFWDLVGGFFKRLLPPGNGTSSAGA